MVGLFRLLSSCIAIGMNVCLYLFVRVFGVRNLMPEGKGLNFVESGWSGSLAIDRPFETVRCLKSCSIYSVVPTIFPARLITVFTLFLSFTDILPYHTGIPNMSRLLTSEW